MTVRKMKKKSTTSPSSTSKVNVKSSTSGDVTVDNDTEFKSALANVRKDTSDNNWVLTQYGGKGVMTYIGTGTGGIAELATKVEDAQIYHGILRVNELVDNKSKTTKFVFVKVIPDEGVQPMKKAEANVKDGAIKKLFGTTTVDYNVAKKDELTETLVMDKVGSASGTKSNVKK